MIAWLLSWALFVCSTAAVWDFVSTGSLRGDRVAVHAILVLLALALMAPVLLVADLFGGIAQRTWAQYDWRFARTVIVAAGLAFLALVIPYGWWVVAPVLTRAGRQVMPWFANTSWAATIEPWRAPPVWTWAILTVVTAALLWRVVATLRRRPFYACQHALEVLGWRQCLRGVCLMAYLRTLVPRRDFFISAPVVSWMPVLAILAVVHRLIPIQLFAIAIPVLVLALVLPMWTGMLAPPVWLFLGTSTVESFDLFHALRSNWRRHGLTLLHRTSPGGLQSYDHWRETTPTTAFYDPGVGRVWSLRTRPSMWQTAVRLTAAFVPVIVIDWRGPSPIVEWEAKWLDRRALLQKAVLIVPSAPAGVHSADDPLQGATTIDEETALASEWAGRSVVRAPAPPT
jgi:hypothetical protein